MKSIQLIFAVLMFLASSFTNHVGKKESYQVSVADSEVHWYAKKVTGAHDGIVMIQTGKLDFEDNKLTGGDFVIDMTTIQVTDLEAGSGPNKKLTGHLHSEDFFHTAQHKTAKLVITEAEETGKQAVSDKAREYNVKGNLTIKGKTNPVEFVSYVKNGGEQAEARATIVFDRSKYDIRYGSKSFFDNLGDNAIYDDVKIEVNLVAKK